MKNLFLWLMLATVSLSQAQTKLNYTFTVSKENIEKNYAIISNDFGHTIKKKTVLHGRNTALAITTAYD